MYSDSYDSKGALIAYTYNTNCVGKNEILSQAVNQSVREGHTFINATLLKIILF